MTQEQSKNHDQTTQQQQQQQQEHHVSVHAGSHSGAYHFDGAKQASGKKSA